MTRADGFVSDRRDKIAACGPGDCLRFSTARPTVHCKKRAQRRGPTCVKGRASAPMHRSLFNLKSCDYLLSAFLANSQNSQSWQFSVALPTRRELRHVFTISAERGLPSRRVIRVLGAGQKFPTCPFRATKKKTQTIVSGSGLNRSGARDSCSSRH